MVLLLRALSRLSLRNLHRLGGWIGRLGYWLSPSYRRRLDDHARLAGVAAADRRDAIASAGHMVAELPWLWLRPPGRPLGDFVRWEGDGLLEQAARDARGVVLLTPHMGCFEVTAQAVAERWGAVKPITVLYRPARQAWLREMQRTARDRPGLATAPATLAGVRQLVRALRRGEWVGLLPDQVPPDGMGVWVPFFGRDAYTMTLAPRLVEQTGAKLLLVWGERLPDGRGWVVRIGEPAEALPARAGHAGIDEWSAACAAQINREMERLIHRSPGQYLWGYNRYKQPRQAAERPTPEAGA